MHDVISASGASPGATTTRYRRRMLLVSVRKINILPQMRKSFEGDEQEELTQSIQSAGMLNAPIVALFTDEELERYLRIINQLWNTSIASTDMGKSCKIDGKRFWYVLLAGERRLRSYRRLVKEKRKSRLLQVVVHEHIDPFHAVDIQFSENCHRRVQPHEEAHAYGEYWALLATQGRELTLSSFAKRVGRSPTAVKAALRFVLLPAVIRNAVAGEWGANIPHSRTFQKERLRLAYGISVELARLSEAGTRESELVDLMVGAIISRTKVEQFKAHVDGMLSEQDQGLLDIMTASVDAATRRESHRRTMDANVSRVLCGWEAWLARALILYKTGQIGRENSLFAQSSIRQRLRVIADLLEQVFDLAYKRPSTQVHRRRTVVRELRKGLEELERELPFQTGA